MNRFDTLLIANRGEIACWVIRSASAMGIRTVELFVESDADALHVARADEAVRIGSYLDSEQILAAARLTAQAQFILATDSWPKTPPLREPCWKTVLSGLALA